MNRLSASRRFGEDDATLHLEEKMWARMQKDRNQRSRSGGVFNLGDDNGPTEVLTHRGQALGDAHDERDRPYDDDEDDLDAEVVDKLHFGGSRDGDSRLTHPQVKAKRCAAGYTTFIGMVPRNEYGYRFSVQQLSCFMVKRLPIGVGCLEDSSYFGTFRQQ